MEGQAGGGIVGRNYFICGLFSRVLEGHTPIAALSAMILRFPKSDSRDVLNCPQLLLTNQKYLLSTSFLLPLKCQVFLQFCMNDPCAVDN